LKVAAVQTGIYPGNEARALRSAVSLVRNAARKEARLICLPEHWLARTTFGIGDRVLTEFSGLARELAIGLNLGGIYFKEGDDTFLVSPTLNSRGEVISIQKKVHLYGREKKRAKPGKEFVPFSFDGVKVGVLVCHDIVFPESARTLVLKGAEILLNPSLIVSAGTEPWLTYLRARALENRVPVAAANAYVPRRTDGKSVIIEPRYLRRKGIMVLSETMVGRGWQVVLANLDLDSLTVPRAERLGERRPDSYAV
jgi:predicted amidohydrolase